MVQGRPDNCFGQDAPDKNLAFPTTANLTATELLTFFPNSLKSADVVYRFISNGATRELLWAIVSTTRDLESEWHPNSTGRFMYDAMRRAGFKKWTVTIHDKWHAARKQIWNSRLLDVAGFRTPCEVDGSGGHAEDIPFAELAIGIRSLPRDDDALDLTAMVEYCVDHPEEEWEYPKDYAMLLDLLGGPREIKAEHIDEAAFARWTGCRPPPPRPRSPKLLSMPGSKRPDMPSDIVRSKEMGARKGSSRGRPRKSEPVNNVTSEPVGRQAQQAAKGDVRAPRYISDPAQSAMPPTPTAGPVEELHHASRTEKIYDRTSASGPHDLEGSRESPSYQELHQIDGPHLADVSVWAENLRCAKE